MTERLVSRQDIADAVGCDKTTIRDRANAESWPYVPTMVRGGTEHRYLVSSLPADVRNLLLRESKPNKTKAYDTATESARTTAGRRRTILESWQTFAAETSGSAEERRTAFCDIWNATHTGDEAVSARTLRRWQQQYTDAGMDGLLPQYGTHNTRNQTIPEDVAATFRALYLDEGKLSVRACHALTQKAFRGTEREADFPAMDAFYRLVKRFDAEEVTLYRDGKDAWRNRCAPYIIREDAEIKPNDVWVGDHRRFDIKVRGANGKTVRPWVTAWFDWGSRTLVGWHVFEGEPCSETILIAFKRGVERHGVPHQIYIDNGKDYRSKAITGGRIEQDKEEGRYLSLASQLGIDVQFATPYNARAKIVERFFKTVKDGFDRLYRSFTGGTTVEKPERLENIQAEDCPTLAAFRQAFVGWVSEYHAQPHTGLDGQTPIQRFATLTNKRVAAAEHLRLCLLKTTQPRTLRRNGVEVLGTWFDAPELRGWFGKKVFVRYDPENMGTVEVYDEQDRFVCTATNRIALQHGADHQDLKAAIREQRARRKRVEEGRRAKEALALHVDPLEMLMEAGAKAMAETPEPPKTPVVSLIVSVQRTALLTRSSASFFFVTSDSPIAPT
ncbi:MAG: Mu transposase C-terminal domain-containing protein [Myxococcales bacterium]|nr:Mu transposase C-terminal domain-containing protein [Myxococcales bacterium]